MQKIVIWTIRSLVHQINCLLEVLKLKLNFPKNKVVTGKILFFVIGPISTHQSICFNIALASYIAVLYGNDAFSILVLSTRKI